MGQFVIGQDATPGLLSEQFLGVDKSRPTSKKSMETFLTNTSEDQIIDVILKIT